MFESLRGGLDVGAETLALETIREEGPGGIFLASDHTLEHFREWVFMSPLFRSQAYPTWTKQGAAETPEVATREWKKLLESWEDPGIDDGVEAGAAASSWPRASGSSTSERPRSAPRRPLRARAHRAEDAAQPLLPGAALHRLRRREALDAGPPPRAQGRGRLGVGVHGVLLDQPRERRVPVRLGAALGRRRRALAAADDRGGARATARSPRSSCGTAGSTSRRASRAPSRSRRARSRASSSRSSCPRRWSSPTSAARRTTGSPPPCGRARPASTSSTSTARTPTCRRSSSRRATTTAPTTTAARSRTARASGWRRSRRCARRSATTARSRSASPPTRSTAPASSPRKGSPSSARPSRSSTSSTASSAASRAPRGSTPAPRASSPRATSSNGRRASARRPRSRSSAPA